jgi:hypothetical protein
MLAELTDKFYVPAETKFSLSSGTIKWSYYQYLPIQTSTVITSLLDDAAATCCSFPISPEVILITQSAITSTN